MRLSPFAVLLAAAAACTPAAEREPARQTAAADAAGSAAAPTVDSSAGALSPAVAEAAASLPTMTVYKSPTCGCCKGWVQHAKNAGFNVVVHDTADVTPVKTQYGVDPKLHSCHTTIVSGYVIEGHVPAEDVKRLLAERPKIAGLAAPGMPSSAPGMDMGHEPYEVVAFTKDGKTSTWAKH